MFTLFNHLLYTKPLTFRKEYMQIDNQFVKNFSTTDSVLEFKDHNKDDTDFNLIGKYKR